MSRRQALVRAGAMAAPVVAVALLAGCTSEPEDEPSPSGESASGDADVQPNVFVVSVPDGFTDVAPDALGPAWSQVLTSDACTLQGRGDVDDDAVPDMREDSLVELAAAAPDGGAEMGEATDVTVTTEGSPTGGAESELTFVSTDWVTEDGVSRAVARTANLVTFDGGAAHETLVLQLSCTGDADIDATWQAVMESVRPVMHVAEDEPWTASGA